MTDEQGGFVDGCDFCDIGRGADDFVQVVAESAGWVAFFPHRPATPGHTLVIPRRHWPDLWALDDSLATDLTAAVLKVGRAIERSLTPEGMNLISSAGEAAEQSVFHLHLHVVPRWKRDGFGRIWPHDDTYEDSELGDVASKIREALAAEAES